MSQEPAPVPPRITSALAESWIHLAEGGTWWTASEQLSLARLARTAFAERFAPPWSRSATDEALATAPIAPEAARAIVTIAADARTIDRAWAEAVIAELGDIAYVELVAIGATIAAVDAFASARGVEVSPLPDPAPEADVPTRTRPEGMGDAGAYVDMAVPWSDANVARALTLAPRGNLLYRRLGMALYHDGHFLDLDWDRPLSRPQTEVVATTVSAVNECFY